MFWFSSTRKSEIWFKDSNDHKSLMIYLTFRILVNIYGRNRLNSAFHSNIFKAFIYFHFRVNYSRNYFRFCLIYSKDVALPIILNYEWTFRLSEMLLTLQKVFSEETNDSSLFVTFLKTRLEFSIFLLKHWKF